MNKLVQEIVNSILQEDARKVTAIYGGGFKPPTKGHFDLVKMALKDMPEIDKFLVYVGGGTRDGIEQEQSLQIWDTYQEVLGNKVEPVPSVAPIGDIMRYAKDHPTEEVYFVIGYREGREDDIQDIKNRTKGVEEKYPNLKVKVIKTPSGDMSGTNARKALKKGDKEKFFTFLPDEIPANEKEEIYNIASKSIVQETPDPQSGKAAPFGSGYKPLNENTIPSIDIAQKCAELTQHMIDKGYNIEPLPSVQFVGDDVSNAEEFLGKTAYYDPQEKMIVLYTYGRHPKDIVRSYAHEMVHHMQNLENRLGNVSTTNTLEDDHVNNLEKEANLVGTMTFREWTDGLQEDGKKISTKNMDDYKKQVNENALANIIAKIAAPLVNMIISRAIDGLFGYADDIKNIVAPEPYIKFLKGLEKNDEFNKQFIELIVQRDKEKNTPLGNEWRELTTNLPAFKEAFDKFAEEQGIEETDKNNLLFKISKTMWDTYLRAWKKIHQTLKKKYPDLTQDLRETQLTEGRYDKLTNELSSFAFELMKDGYDVGKKVVDELFVVGPADEEVDIVSDEFEFDFVVQATYTDDTYKVDGGANAGFDDEKEEIQPLLTVRFEIPKDIDWQTVSFDLKDVIRHELEHLTQDGANVRPGKKIEDDKFIRDLINADLLPKAAYFQLEKEVDAMLQGMYLKAKKSRRPFIEVIDDYLDKQPINQEERKEILNLWSKRVRNIGLPMFEEQEKKPKKYYIFSDMDGVLADFDKGYRDLTGMTTQHADSQGKNEFWKIFRNSLKEKGISEKEYWAGLDWMSDGKKYWDYIKQYNPYVLTAPSVNFDAPEDQRYSPEYNQSMQGKTEWGQRLSNMRKMYFASAKNKVKFARPNTILIDDRKDTIDAWNAAGGIGIFHTSADDTIKQLQDLGL